ncbi:MAG: alpha/beta fold hydrolase [Pseudomonadota bacterium]
MDAWREGGAGHTVLGHNIFVREEGQGIPLLLLHGFPSCSWDWHRIAPLLTDEFRLIMPDFLGLGFSDKPRRHEYSIFEQADIIELLVEDRGLTQCAVLAHDYGDSVLQELLARQQEGRLGFHIPQAMMLNGGLFPEAHNPLPSQKWLGSSLGFIAALYMQKPHFAKAMQVIAGVDNPPDPDIIDGWWEALLYNRGKRIVHRLARYMNERITQKNRWAESLKHATIPLAMVNGTLDPISGSEMVAMYEREVPEPRIVRLPTVGHYPHIEAPESVAKLVRQFFSRRSRQRMASTPAPQQNLA